MSTLSCVVFNTLSSMIRQHLESVLCISEHEEEIHINPGLPRLGKHLGWGTASHTSACLPGANNRHLV